MTGKARSLWPFRLALFATGTLSVGSLLLYFYGVGSFTRLSIWMLSVELVALCLLARVALRRDTDDARQVLFGGLWAGSVASLAYDIVRVPIVHAGTPVFKAISYFGTVLLGLERPTAASEILGWAYHLSNGVSFALMYAAVVVSPGPASAVLWGLALEGIMLLTPYVEVFGYQRDARFLATSIGAHTVYGLAIWLGLRAYGSGAKRLAGRWVVAGYVVVLAGLTAMAVDFHEGFGARIPPSPPSYIGPHLYVAWNVPEPDRIGVIWVMTRFVDREAVFHFIEPFDQVKVGKPFDIPEADVRRSATQSATEILIAERGLKDPKLDALARMTALTEITPWRLAADLDAGNLAERLRTTAESRCGKNLATACLPAVLRDLDEWYANARP